MIILRSFIILTVLCYVTLSASAHDMYIIPKPFVLKKSDQSSLAMFLQSEPIVWFTSMTVAFRVIGPEMGAGLEVPDEGDPVIQFKEDGTYVIGWTSQPSFLQTEPELFKKYILLEGYQNVIKARKDSGKDNDPGREIFSRFLKTFVQVGSEKTEHFKKPFGFKIEIIPLTNPCTLKVGSELDVQVLFDGAPLADRKIMATYDSYSTVPEEYAQATRTDENGIARFQITHPGVWMIRTNQILPLQNNREADWESFWANCTFEVPR